MRAGQLVVLAALFALGVSRSAAAGELPWEQAELWGGFVFRVEAEGGRTIACTTGGSYLSTEPGGRWGRIDRPGADLVSPVRLLGGRIFCEENGEIRFRDETTGAWTAGPRIGGTLYDATARPGEKPEILFAARRPLGGGSRILVTVLRTDGSSRRQPIGTVPRHEPGGGAYPRLAVHPADPARIRLAVPLRDPVVTYVFGTDAQGGEWSRWELPIYLNVLAAVPGRPETWVGVALPNGVEGEPLGLVRSDDGARTWREAGTDPRLRRLRSLVFRPETGRLLVGTFDGAVLETPDLGETLVVRREGRGADNITSIAVVPGRPERILIGTQTGFYRTEDDGKSWRLEVDRMATGQFTGLVAGDDGRVVVFEFHGGPRSSSDGGRTFTAIDPTFKGSYGRVFLAFSVGDTVAIDAARIGAITTLLVSRDAGRTWTATGETSSNRWLLGVLPGGEVYGWDGKDGLLRFEGGTAWRTLPGFESDPPFLPTRVLPGEKGQALFVGHDRVFRRRPEAEGVGQPVRIPEGARPAMIRLDPLLPSVGYVTGSGGGALRGRLGEADWPRVLDREGAWFLGVVVDPARPKRRIAGLSDGAILVSEDEGLTWRTLEENRFESLGHLAVGPDRRLHVLADGGLHSLDLAALDGD